jgi:prepilin-type N-terminal cleavage/methylation domain-containing protein
MTPLQSRRVTIVTPDAQPFFRKQIGFSLIEMLIVMSILLIATAIGFIELRPAMNQIRVSNAYNTTLMTIRRAREAAIGQRRTYIVTFNNAVVPNSVTIAPASVTPGGLNVTYTLPNDVFFTATAGLPAIGPDGFGTGATAIDFDQNVGGGNKTSIYFFPDGSAQDVNNNTNNGVVYMGRNADLYSSMAITLWGATGRLRGWKLTNVAGAPTWKQQ